MGPNGSGKTTLAYALMGHPAYVDQGRRGPLEGPRHPQAVGRQARPARPLPRLPVPDRDPRPVSVASFIRSALNAKLQGIDKNPDIDPTDAVKGGVSHARLPQQDAREDGAPADGRGLRVALRQRRLLGRREEAPRDAPDGGPRARDGDPRRDRLRARHRRPADRRRGRQRDAQPEPRRPADHPLPAPAQLHHPGRRPRPGPGQDRHARAARTSRCVSRTRATARSCARTATRPTCPTRRCSSRRRRPAPTSKPWRPPARRASTDDGRPPSRRRDASTPHALRADFPILAAADQRAPARLPRLGVDEPEADRSSSTPSPTTTASTTPTSIAGSTRSARRRRPSTRRPGRRSRGSSTPRTATRSSSPATRPRRSTSSPTRGAGGTSTAATRSS